MKVIDYSKQDGVHDAVEKVVTKIFYSQATNGKAEESIEDGIAEVKKILADYSSSTTTLTESELKQQYAEHLGVTDLDTSCSTAIEFAFKTLTNESNR